MQNSQFMWNTTSWFCRTESIRTTDEVHIFFTLSLPTTSRKDTNAAGFLELFVPLSSCLHVFRIASITTPNLTFSKNERVRFIKLFISFLLLYKELNPVHYLCSSYSTYSKNVNNFFITVVNGTSVPIFCNQGKTLS